MNLLTTIARSNLDGFFPQGWDLARLDACCAHKPEQIHERQAHWSPEFQPVGCNHVYDLDTYVGHEIAMQIKLARDRGEKLALILPVGPVGMYRWAVYFLKSWNVAASHVYGFNMDEWSDEEGNTLPPSNPGSFQYVMEQEFYGPLGDLSVPVNQRFFATKDMLPQYSEQIRQLKAEGAKLIVIYGIGRVFHIAFWEPQFAAEYNREADWQEAAFRIGAKLHPLTVEQNAITSFKSRTTLVPCRANTIGPGLFLQADYAIGGADGALGRGMTWQAMSLWVTLRYGADTWVPSSYMPTMPGRLYYLNELAGPLEPELN